MSVSRDDEGKFYDRLMQDATACPRCTSDDLLTYDRDGANTMTCRVVCNACKLLWTETYRLQGVDNFGEDG